MTLVTPLTPAPTPPSIGTPATFPTLASAFVAWQAASATEFNTAIGQINAIDFGILHATYGGTANAITLTATGVTLSTGLRISFIPTAANTAATTINLNGGGAVTVQPLARSGVALPSGYIIANTPVMAVYNGTVWLIERQTEFGTNANGDFARFADGTQICHENISYDAGSDVTLFRATWTFPVAFSTTPSGSAKVGRAFLSGTGDASAYVAGDSSGTPSTIHGINTTQMQAKVVRTAGNMKTIELNYMAMGVWF